MALALIDVIILWVGCGALLISAIGFTIAFWRSRKFTIGLSAGVLHVAAFAYCAMAFDVGAVDIAGHHVLWARYADYLITTPMMIFDLLSANTAVSCHQKLVVVGVDIMMIIAGLCAALVPAPVKWVFFAYGSFAYVILLILFRHHFHAIMDLQQQRKQGSATAYKVAAYIFALTWTGYPVLFLVGEEGLHILRSEIDLGLHLGLDVISKVVVAVFLMRVHANIGAHDEKRRSSRYMGGRGGSRSSVVKTMASAGVSNEAVVSTTATATTTNTVPMVSVSTHQSVKRRPAVLEHQSEPPLIGTPDANTSDDDNSSTTSDESYESDLSYNDASANEMDTRARARRMDRKRSHKGGATLRVSARPKRQSNRRGTNQVGAEERQRGDAQVLDSPV